MRKGISAAVLLGIAMFGAQSQAAELKPMGENTLVELVSRQDSSQSLSYRLADPARSVRFQIKGPTRVLLRLRGLPAASDAVAVVLLDGMIVRTARLGMRADPGVRFVQPGEEGQPTELHEYSLKVDEGSHQLVVRHSQGGAILVAAKLPSALALALSLDEDFKGRPPAKEPAKAKPEPSLPEGDAHLPSKAASPKAKPTPKKAPPQEALKKAPAKAAPKPELKQATPVSAPHPKKPGESWLQVQLMGGAQWSQRVSGVGPRGQFRILGHRNLSKDWQLLAEVNAGLLQVESQSRAGPTSAPWAVVDLRRRSVSLMVGLGLQRQLSQWLRLRGLVEVGHSFGDLRVQQNAQVSQASWDGLVWGGEIGAELTQGNLRPYLALQGHGQMGSSRLLRPRDPVSLQLSMVAGLSVIVGP